MKKENSTSSQGQGKQASKEEPVLKSYLEDDAQGLAKTTTAGKTDD